MALTKLPTVRTPLSAQGVWIVPVSKTLRLGCLLQACPNPECPCTELMLSTGEVRGHADSPIDERDRRVAAIVDALDAATLDELEALWRRQRGLASQTGRRRAEIGPWKPGELVYWDEVFEVDRPEIFLDSERHVGALDMYCVAPHCDCREVRVGFREETLPGESAPPPIGLVVAAFDGQVRFEPARPQGDARLRALWARYRRRHPGLQMLLHRYGELRDFAAEHAANGAPVSRSAPCAYQNASAPEGVPELAAERGTTSTHRDQNAGMRWVSTSRKRNKAARRG